MSTSRRMIPSETYILGAPDPEMSMIERLLREDGTSEELTREQVENLLDTQEAA